MCLYPKLIINKKYTVNKKNNGVVPNMIDDRVRYVPVGCGQCIECRRQKANEWKVRLQEELRNSKEQAYFVTLTFRDDEIDRITNELGCNECNSVAIYAVRHYLERWRKKYKKSIKHWLITELGHPHDNNRISTERIHLHGIIWTDKPSEEIERIWRYGYVYIGDYVNNKTINYVVKYVTKIDNDHKGYIQKIMCSKGIGAGYMERKDSKNNAFRGAETDETYRAENGARIALPIYYRNKIYTEAEREQLWLEKLNKGIIYVNGNPVQAADEERYMRMLHTAQQTNKRLGYGDDSEVWRARKYAARLDKLNSLTAEQREKLREKIHKRADKENAKFREKLLNKC